MGRMAVVVDTGKHQRCNPEPEFKLGSAESVWILSGVLPILIF